MCPLVSLEEWFIGLGLGYSNSCNFVCLYAHLGRNVTSQRIVRFGRFYEHIPICIPTSLFFDLARIKY